MKVSELMQQMSDAGAPMEAIVIAVRALEDAQGIVDEKRAKEAERSARYRRRGGGQIPDQMRRAVFTRDDYTCVDCGAKDNLSCDHIIPVSKGGGTNEQNLQTLCTPCNSRKRDRIRKRDVRRRSTDKAGQSIDTPLSLSPNDNNSNPHTHTPVNIPRARKGPDFPKLDCSDEQTWADFLKNRKAKRLTNTPTAHAKLLSDLAKCAQETGWPPGKVFKACVAKGWGAIYDPRQDEKKPKNVTSYSKPTGTATAAQRAIETLGG